MVYTITFNPALDYAVCADDIKVGETNRSHDEYILTGGKGINVSTMLCNLGVENTALGFIGGFTGQEIKKRVEQNGCKCDFIEVDGISRINVKIKSELETEINASGPMINDTDIEKLIEKIRNINKDDILVLAGSVSTGINDKIYSKIMRNAPHGVKIIVDAAGSLLMNAIKQNPFLVKPNNYELSAILGEEVITDRKIMLQHADNLRSMGASNVLVSLAGNGAVLSTSYGCHFESPAPEGKVIDSVGAGDSMVAGFIAGWIESKDFHHAFKMGIAAGSASAFSRGFASKEEVLKIYDTIK